MGDKYYATFNADGSLSQRLVASIHSIPKTAVPVDDGLWMRMTQESDGLWVLGKDKVIKKEPFPEATPDFLEMIAKARYDRETAGILVGGAAIDTDRESQSLITSSAVHAMMDPNCSFSWKTKTGFVELSATDMLRVASDVMAHVQACFDREKALLLALSKGELTEAMLADGWPVSGDAK